MDATGTSRSDAVGVPALEPGVPPVPTTMPDVVAAAAFDPAAPASAGAPAAAAAELPLVVVQALPESPPELAVDPDVAAARALLRQGAVREVLALLTPHHRDRDLVRRAVVLASLVEARLARGDVAEATALGDDLTPLLDAGGAVAALAHHARGVLASALGDPDLAVAHLLTVGRLRPDIDPDLAPWRSEAALAQLRSGDARAATDLARRGVAAARADGRAHVVVHAMRVLATVDPGVDRLGHLRSARALLPDGTADRLAAQIDTDLACLVLLSPRHSHPTGADQSGPDPLTLLRSAERLAGRQELWPLQGRIRRLLDVLGETPRRVNGEAEAALTPSELRVSRLAVNGLGNRAIALELGVGVKAVEWHLGHVYRKLALTSRAELAGALGPVAATDAGGVESSGPVTRL